MVSPSESDSLMFPVTTGTRHVKCRGEQKLISLFIHVIMHTVLVDNTCYRLLLHYIYVDVPNSIQINISLICIRDSDNTTASISATGMLCKGLFRSESARVFSSNFSTSALSMNAIPLSVSMPTNTALQGISSCFLPAAGQCQQTDRQGSQRYPA